MGNIQPNNKQTKTPVKTHLANEDRKRNAIRRFHVRLKEYKGEHHGDYSEYVDWCCKQYKIDLLNE